MMPAWFGWWVERHFWKRTGQCPFTLIALSKSDHPWTGQLLIFKIILHVDAASLSEATLTSARQDDHTFIIAQCYNGALWRAVAKQSTDVNPIIHKSAILRRLRRSQTINLAIFGVVRDVVPSADGASHLLSCYACFNVCQCQKIHEVFVQLEQKHELNRRQL